MTRTTDLPWEEISRRIELQMLNAGIRSTADLSRRTGLNRSTLSLKMTGVRRWRIADLGIIAAALSTSVGYLIGEVEDPRSAPVVADADADTETVLVPTAEFARRLTFLDASAPSMVGQVSDHEVLFALSDLEEVADEFNVPLSYLTEFGDDQDADRVEALVEFSRVAAASGVQRIAARSLSALSAAELRALTQVIGTR
ncbi:helix-turn-helix domain-containing protein [Microbacterium sp. p3-SID336]|uniref:helix-turn-helix domain-containing protein n=1 Tax=Microbacterium sp. p3-SID336 TaxID=2916212 RepID=UPI0021A87B78|nr:helix-turn-helix transcriptional regulator [Microbacterium sp. p3-SID336]MCT1478491.1 helix-turn-helix transcriptional regulator [Microbacterium sp. p3-SID336]